MIKLKNVEFPSKNLSCYESVLVTIINYLGLSEKTPLMGTQAYFVLNPTDLRISSRFNRVDEEWQRVYGLKIETLPAADEVDLRAKIIARLDQDMPVCLPVDLYSLPHTLHYNQLHQHHYVNVFGYDDDRYYMVCPYYRFQGWVDTDLIHTGFFSPTVTAGIGTRGQRLIVVPALELETLSAERVRALVEQSCQHMLGLTVPAEMADTDPQHLGLAGIRTFATRFQQLAAEWEQGEDSPHKTTFIRLSRQITSIGYSRHWFHNLIRTCQPPLLSPDLADDLKNQFNGVVQSWKSIGMRLGMGVHGQRTEKIQRAAQRLGQIHQQETQLFESLWAALSDTKLGERTIKGPASLRSVYAAPSTSTAWHEPRSDKPFVAPRTSVEKSLAQIWTQVLNLNALDDHQVGVHDNFFEIGGDSVLATQIVSWIRNTFRVAVPLRDIFEVPTIAGLAASIDREQRAKLNMRVSPLQPASRDEQDENLTLSFAQQRMWFLDQLQPGSPFYNLPRALRLTGPLSIEMMERSLGEIVRRHESLRTTFATVDGLPRQVIAPTAAMPLPVMDLQHLDASTREVRARQLAEEEAQRPFDLTRDLPLRATLLRLAETEHVLLLTMHHIASDGWSMGVLIRELVAIYPAFCAGQPCPLPELPIQYADFATWQRERLRGDVLETQRDYWKRQLGGSLPVLELPTDRPRPAVQTVHGARQTFTLSQELSKALKTLSRQERVTPFMTLLAALKTLLSRYTGQDDVIVGSPIANRNRAEIESLIGFFANTLVLRTDLSGDPTFRELLDRVREVALGAYEHQELPFEKLVEELEPERDLSRTPLFQVLFAMQNAPMTALTLPDLTLKSLRIDKGTSKFDLSLAMWNTSHGLMGRVEYNTDLFDATTIDRLLQHFQSLLENVVANPDQPIADVSILTKAERNQLAAWNDTAADYAETRCVHELIEAQVEKNPTAVAVAFEGEHYTYRELNRRANQLAHHLQDLGVGPDVRVGLFVERSLDVVLGLLGILKAGGAYVPLDPIYPQDRIDAMLRDAQALVLLTQAHLADDLPALDTRVVCLDRDWDLIARNSDDNPPIVVDPSNLMYVLFTSGSTGRPKGVAVEQRNFLNYIHGAVQRLDVPDGLSFAIVSTFAADLGSTNVFGALCTGGQIHVVPYERVADPDAMSDYFCRHPIDAMKLVPSHFEVWQGLSDLSAVIPRQRLIFAGEASYWEMIERVRALSPGCVIQNHYGPTETTVSVLAYPVPDQRPAYHTATVPLGRPLGNVRLYVLSARMQPTPVGVPGELYIGGASVSRGYLDRPALTAASFVPDPFGTEPGGRLYRSGDRVRYLPDGNVEFLGRVDQQIKIRGYRVEPGEIETLLTGHPSVQDTVVILREDAPGDPSKGLGAGKRLVAYVVPHPEHAASFTSIPLRDHLRGQLPNYMIPAIFVPLEEIPLNPNGKVNRQALPLPGGEHVERERVFVAPSTPFEEILAEVWEEVLQVAEIGVHDNFFDLGGHSLLATQVISRVRDRFEIEMPVRTLFEAPTIAEMALRVEEILVAEIDALDDDEARNLINID